MLVNPDYRNESNPIEFVYFWLAFPVSSQHIVLFLVVVFN